MGVFVIMEYTKDMILNISYGDDTQIVKLKKDKTYKRIFKAINENKFITITLLLTFFLVLLDLIFIVNFINIASML